MGDPVTIVAFHIENVKRVKAVHMEPSQNGLTVIGGKNGQGKTSILDALTWGLGGGKREPSNAKRDGALSNPEIDITLSNGLRVTRSGKNGTLSVVDPSGTKGGQTLLDAFVSQFALDLPKFLDANTKEKAQILLRILGIGDKLAELDQQEKALYDRRHAIGQIADQKKKYADELPEYADAPDEPVSVSELIQQQQAILAKNGENQRKRQQVADIQRSYDMVTAEVARLSEALEESTRKQGQFAADLATAKQSAEALQDESTAELEASLANIEAINAAVAANQQKQNAVDEAEQYSGQYDELTQQIETVRTARMSLLDGANLPLPGLTVVDGELLFNGQHWDCMSGAEQLSVAVAIVRRLNPECGFVLMDKLEQMDVDTLKEFGAWLEGEGLQVIATRVSTGDECSIIIEDGLPQGKTYVDVATGVDAGSAIPWED